MNIIYDIFYMTYMKYVNKIESWALDPESFCRLKVQFPVNSSSKSSPFHFKSPNCFVYFCVSCCTEAVPYPCEPYPWIELLQLGNKRRLTLEVCDVWGRHFVKLFFSPGSFCITVLCRKSFGNGGIGQVCIFKGSFNCTLIILPIGPLCDLGFHEVSKQPKTGW